MPLNLAFQLRQTVFNFAGLIELPEAVQFNQAFLRPARLPTNCDGTPDNSIVMVVGIQSPKIQRCAMPSCAHCPTTIASRSIDVIHFIWVRRWLFVSSQLAEGTCFWATQVRKLSFVREKCPIWTHVCGIVVVLGGPLVRHKDGRFVGIASFITMREGRISGQIFTDLTYYFEWISSKTGLDLPKCQHPTVWFLRALSWSCGSWMLLSKGFCDVFALIALQSDKIKCTLNKVGTKKWNANKERSR